MKKLVSILAALSITLNTVIFAADLENTITIEKNINLTTLTPTGGVLLEASEARNTGYRSVMLMSSVDDEQTFEEYLRQQLTDHSTTIDVSKFKIPVSEFADKYFAFIFCNSDLPIRAAYNNDTSFTENGVEYMLSINPSYIYATKAECDSKFLALDALTTSLAEYASVGRTELEKALFLFDKISLDYYYTPGDTFEKINYTPYSFLDKGHGVCQGYAILYKLVLDKLNIENYVCGNFNKSINHAWNYIKIDGKWYHADPTWSYYSDATDKVSREYFLLSDAAMAADEKHGIKTDWEAQRSSLIPIDCTSDEYEDGYLFHEFTGDPIYRDASSLYFSTTFNETYNLTMRNDSLKTPDAVMSVPDSSYGVYLYTINARNDASNIIIASYGQRDKFLRCSMLTADVLPANLLISIPHTPESDVTKLKWMLISSGTLSPITYYAEATIGE